MQKHFYSGEDEEGKMEKQDMNVKIDPDILSGKRNIFGRERVAGAECGCFSVCEFSSPENCRVCGSNFNYQK